ncbi:MAG: hypothetical protein EP323_04515 [Gammaproteobacteria bacterium]|nr:MAG: hypothetical protein EP323_04515 [Gammaproteobacteria bacterium]
MPVIDKKYETLSLTDDYLSDPLLMALAWKKSHEYIRTTNWYADHFDLDQTALDLASICDKWSKDIKNNLTFKDLELVPAPKACSWKFSKPEKKEFSSKNKQCLEWMPEHPDKVKLRPLAHIDIKDQTIMTLVMMCLANEVETKQGDPSTPYPNVHKKRTASYGNRLYCRYTDDSAEYSYGATTTYSKYFGDYRRFLQRPYHFAGQAIQERTPETEVYLVDLDLEKFFDRIDKQKLIRKIERLARTDARVNKGIARQSIWDAFKNWKWSEQASLDYGTCSKDSTEPPPNGLPQGLVASGFLSNIYMLDFDDHMQDRIGTDLNSDKRYNFQINLIDYCRYVDDLRLVVTGPSRQVFGSSPISIIKDQILATLEPKLNELELSINTEKTKIEIYRGKSVGISKSLEDIQSRVSGPLSHEDSIEQLNQLESLMALASTTTEDQPSEGCRVNRLAQIEKDIFDVREDTLKRFAANKISSLLSSVRHFTSRDVDEVGSAIPGDWDYLQERLARRFIACWSRDPSLVLLLKKGLELFPSPSVLEPVLEQLHEVIETTSDDRTRPQAVARYCLAEIFRHSSTVIHRKDLHAIPAHADVDAYFEILQHNAISLVKKLSGTDDGLATFDFLSDQARFLLLVRLDTTLEQSSGHPHYDLIFKLAAGFRKISAPKSFDSRDLATCILLAGQISGETKALIRATAELLEQQNDVEVILERLAEQNTGFLRSLVLHARPLRYEWVKSEFTKNLIARLYFDIRPSGKSLSEITEKIPLYKLTSRKDNPFSNEIMALKLMLALLDKADDIASKASDQVIDLSKTSVKIKSGSYLLEFSTVTDELSVENIAFHAPLSTIAAHLKIDHKDTLVLQRIALCIRAALSGGIDPTGFGSSIEPRAGYRGIKSTQYKRQIGLITSPETLIGETAQFSGWLSTLLSKLLRWPGIRVNDQSYDWPVELTIKAVTQLAQKRLSVLEEQYCQQTGIPGLLERVKLNWPIDKKELSVAMIQSKMPSKNDFSLHGPFLNDNHYRSKHRRHVARVSKLILAHIEAQQLETGDRDEGKQHIDLIVWPELAVHEDDLGILVQLSRKTHAIVLAGLTFTQIPGVKGPNNCAVWIVPRKHNTNQQEILRLQGKHHMMEGEKKINIQPWRPYQLMLELTHPQYPTQKGFVLTGAICYDATDIALNSDLRDKSNALLVPALNRDVNTFDSMVEALHYHMYQHVVMVNSGEFGGSCAMAPYNERHKRLIAHIHGNDQVGISTFKMNMFDFRRDQVGKSLQSGMAQKMPPAGVPKP